MDQIWPIMTQGWHTRGQGDALRERYLTIESNCTNGPGLALFQVNVFWNEWLVKSDFLSSSLCALLRHIYMTLVDSMRADQTKPCCAPVWSDLRTWWDVTHCGIRTIYLQVTSVPIPVYFIHVSHMCCFKNRTSVHSDWNPKPKPPQVKRCNFRAVSD